MRLKLVCVLLTVILFLGGCVATSKYKIDKIEQQFPNDVKHSAPMTVAKFDAVTPSKAIEMGGVLFGAIGVLVANAATASDLEVLGINLQNKTMEMLEEEIPKININYKSHNLMEGTTVEEVSKRFKSNRLWGFSSLKDEEIKDYFQKNSNVDFLIHITSLVAEQFPNLIVDTKWMIYDKNGLMVAKIRTRSVDALSKQNLSEESYFKGVVNLQYKNIKEFIKMLSSTYT